MGLIFFEAEIMTCEPVATLPVKAILSMSGCSDRYVPDFPRPVITFSTPGGRPTSRVMSASSNAVRGVSSEGLRTTVQPAASAGAIFQEAINSG